VRVRSSRFVEASEVLEQLTDARLMRAVTEYLFQKEGLEPLGATEAGGRGARVRLDALGRRCRNVRASSLPRISQRRQSTFTPYRNKSPI
jgi:hypothetical protein